MGNAARDRGFPIQQRLEVAFVESKKIGRAASPAGKMQGRAANASDVLVLVHPARAASNHWSVIGGFRMYNASAENELNGLAGFALRAVPGFGRAHAQSVRRLWGHALHVGAIGESLPNRAGNGIGRVEIPANGVVGQAAAPLTGCGNSDARPQSGRRRLSQFDWTARR